MAAGTSVGAGIAAPPVAKAIFDAAENRLSDAITQLQSIAGSLDNYSQTLQIRSTFLQILHAPAVVAAS